jgi:hypothetical protein
MQTRKGSLIEASINIGSGFFLSFLLWQFVAAPLFGYEVTFLDNLGLTSIFTVASIIRSYVWRRVFNHLVHVRGYHSA